MSSDRTKEATKLMHLSIMEEAENLASDKHNQFQEHDDDDMFLPGFRFHPTDEELVGFYLRRKVQNRLATLDFIKQIDIYKFDPWDLPSMFNSITYLFFFNSIQIIHHHIYYISCCFAWIYIL